MARASIQTDLSLDTTAFQRGLAKSEKGIKNFVSNGIKQFGALAGAAGMGAMAKSAIDLGSKISDMAVQLNIGATELQVLEFAAREAGVEVSVMERALRNVQLRTQEAINGNKSYGNAFKRLGIDIHEFNNLPTEKKLEAVAVAQSKATDKAAAFNDVAIILGQRAGPAMQEVLQNLAGPKGYGGLEAAAKRANEVMSDETIAKMDKAADTIESFKRKMTVLTAEVLGVTVPAFSIFSNGLGSVGDIAGSLISKFASFLGFLGRSVGATIDPVVKQFESLAAGLKGVALSFKEPKKAAESFNQALELQKESAQALVSIPDKIAAEYKRANEAMELVSESLDRSMLERADNIEKAWADMWGNNVETTTKATKKIGAEIAALSNTELDALNEKEAAQKRTLDLIYAQISGNKEAIRQAELAIEKEGQIEKIIKDTGVSRAEALRIITQKNYALDQQKQKQSEITKATEREAAARGKSLASAEAMYNLIQKSKTGTDIPVTKIETEKLEWTLSQAKSALDKIMQESKGTRYVSREAAQYLAGAQVLKTDIKKIQEELKKRKSFESMKKQGERHVKAFMPNPYERERLERLTSHQDESTKLLRDIGSSLQGINRVTSKLDRNLS